MPVGAAIPAGSAPALPFRGPDRARKGKQRGSGPAMVPSWPTRLGPVRRSRIRERYRSRRRPVLSQSAIAAQSRFLTASLTSRTLRPDIGRSRGRPLTRTGTGSSATPPGCSADASPTARPFPTSRFAKLSPTHSPRPVRITAQFRAMKGLGHASDEQVLHASFVEGIQQIGTGRSPKARKRKLH